MAGQKPTVGRIVHYVSGYGMCSAATVTEVAEGRDSLVGLFVMGPAVLRLLPLEEGGVLADQDEKQRGTWHWPERA